jgi:hypothetical protein
MNIYICQDLYKAYCLIQKTYFTLNGQGPNRKYFRLYLDRNPWELVIKIVDETMINYLDESQRINRFKDYDKLYEEISLFLSFEIMNSVLSLYISKDKPHQIIISRNWGNWKNPPQICDPKVIYFREIT